jgi:putative ABC transport system ATP-binding protein
MASVAAAVAPLVSARRVSVAYGATTILAGVDCDVAPAEALAITGRSGSGKTSLLLALAGLVAPSGGSVAWPGLSADPAVRRNEIGMVFQAPALLPELTAVENVTLLLRLRGGDVDQAARAALDALELVGLADAAGALPAELSGGQQQRVTVARVLAARPRLLLADEPTGSLDRVHAAEILDVLCAEVARHGVGLVVATHDEELAGLLPRRLEVSDGALLPVGR